MKLGDVGPITVESPNLNLGPSLRQHVERGIERSISRSFNTLQSATISFKEEGGLLQTTIKMRVEGYHEEFVAETKGSDCYKSFNMALIKLDGQLRKTKEALRTRKGHRRPDKDGMLSPRMTRRWEEPESDYA